MNEITVVTFFFYLGRKDWDGFERSKNNYMNYFDFWARIRNKLIVYTDKSSAGDILAIRKKYGLENRTIINIIEDYRKIDSEMYESITKATVNNKLKRFRLNVNNPESWNSEYNYINCLKTWFVKDSVKRKQADGMIAYVDFGYNHGGEVLSDPTDFDFLWNYNFSNKFHIFVLHELPNDPIFEIIRQMHSYVTGTQAIAPDYLWEDAWKLVRKAVFSLNICGLSDHDQTVMLMAYRMKPDFFEIHISNWFMPIKEYGNKNMKVIDKKNTFTKRQKIVFRFYRIRHLLKYAINTFIILNKEY